MMSDLAGATSVHAAIKTPSVRQRNRRHAFRGIVSRDGSSLFGTVLLGALLTVAPGSGYAQALMDRGQIQPAPGWGYGFAPIPYWSYWYNPCYPFASCWAYQQFQMFERRRERFEELARAPQPGPPIPSGLPLGHRSAEATSSDDGDVQPAYFGSGRIRDGYRKSGDFLPEFLDGRVRPSR